MGLVWSFLQLVNSITANLTVFSIIGVLSFIAYRSYSNARELDEKLVKFENEFNGKQDESKTKLEERFRDLEINFKDKWKIKQQEMIHEIKKELEDDSNKASGNICKAKPQKEETLTNKGENVSQWIVNEKNTSDKLNSKTDEMLAMVSELQREEEETLAESTEKKENLAKLIEDLQKLKKYLENWLEYHSNGPKLSN